MGNMLKEGIDRDETRDLKGHEMNTAESCYHKNVLKWWNEVDALSECVMT